MCWKFWRRQRLLTNLRGQREGGVEGGVEPVAAVQSGSSQCPELAVWLTVLAEPPPSSLQLLSIPLVFLFIPPSCSFPPSFSSSLPFFLPLSFSCSFHLFLPPSTLLFIPPSFLLQMTMQGSDSSVHHNTNVNANTHTHTHVIQQ